MKAPLAVVVAIVHAVEKAGGDLSDIQDLVYTWERLAVNAAGPRRSHGL